MQTATVSLQPALERLVEIAALPENWDGAGALPPSARAVARACLLIEAAAERHEQSFGGRVAPWTSAPIPDGGLQVEWLGPSARIDVQIAPDGVLGYMTKHGSGAGAGYEEADEVDLATVLERIAHVLAS